MPDEEILRALEQNGVGIGTFSFSLDPEGLRNRVLLEIPELSWLTVNVSGCRATVQVRERVKKAGDGGRAHPPPTWWPAGRGWFSRSRARRV